jgi:hypothetical protein
MSGKTTLWDLTRHVLLLIIACLINFALLWVFAEWSEDQKEFEGFIGFWLFVLTLGAYFLLIRILWEEALLINRAEKEVLLRKLRFGCRGIGTELPEEIVSSFFDEQTLEERIIRAYLENGAHTFAEPDVREWLSVFLSGGSLERVKHQGH